MLEDLYHEANWLAGDLTYRRDSTQRKIHAAIQAAPPGASHFLCCSRRLGKTFELYLEAVELCLTKAGARVLYLMPHAKDAAELATDTAAQIFSDCPKHLQPEYKAQTKEFIFHNGSILRLKGVNGEHAQYLRGGAADLVVLDECGLMDDLRHVVSDVVFPMTMTTGGRILFATTPARSPSHESFAIFNDHADAGRVSYFTLLDNPRITEDTRGQYLRAAGESVALIPFILAGTAQPQTTTAKREYFCQWVTDAETAVVPEYTPEARAEIVVEHQRPAFFDSYVAMDPGFQDKTGLLFGYWDFLANKLVIEDEALLTRAATTDIAKAIRAKEQANWGSKPPILRISDVDLRLAADLWQLHGLAFVAADKADAVGGVNLVRTMIQRREIIISPRCINLDRQIQNAVWDARAKDFERTVLDSHFDLLSALRYLCRGINRTRNPYPEWFRRVPFGKWNSPKSRVPFDDGLLSGTPFGRRVARKNQTRL